MPCDWLLQSHDMMLVSFNGQIITSEDTDRLSNIRNSAQKVRDVGKEAMQ